MNVDPHWLKHKAMTKQRLQNFVSVLLGRLVAAVFVRRLMGVPRVHGARRRQRAAAPHRRALLQSGSDFQIGPKDFLVSGEAIVNCP